MPPQSDRSGSKVGVRASAARDLGPALMSVLGCQTLLEAFWRSTHNPLAEEGLRFKGVCITSQVLRRTAQARWPKLWPRKGGEAGARIRLSTVTLLCCTASR